MFSRPTYGSAAKRSSSVTSDWTRDEYSFRTSPLDVIIVKWIDFRVFVTSRNTPTFCASFASYSLSILNGSAVYLHSQIPGTVPNLRAMPAGCRFAPRCEFAGARCHNEKPPLTLVGDGHRCRCFTPLGRSAAPGGEMV